MPLLVKFKDGYVHECDYSGVKMNSRFAYPRPTTKSGRSTELIGCYVDAACAVAFLLDQATEQLIDKPTLERHLESIRNFLDLKKHQELVRAPAINPTNVDFSYRSKMPWMFKPNLHVSVAHDLDAREKKKKSNVTREKSFNVYDFTDLNAKPTGEYPFEPLTQPSSISLLKSINVGRIQYNNFKGADCIILCEKDGPSNIQAEKVFAGNKEEFAINGKAILLMREKNLGEELAKKAEKLNKEKNKDGDKSKNKNKQTVDLHLSKQILDIYNALPEPDPELRKQKKKRKRNSDSSSSSTDSSSSSSSRSEKDEQLDD